MPILKLDAIPSTNDFLSELVSSQSLENYTAVTAESQTSGRGQRGASWNSQAGKNLTVSILVKSTFTNFENIFVLNAAVAVAVAETISQFGLPDVCIKWPNDILSGSKKISGILIENTLRTNGEVISIVGIGLNVNQLNFEGLPQASSMAAVSGKEFDRDAVLDALLKNVKAFTENAESRTEFIWKKYHDRLFRAGIPSAFEADGKKIMGIIQSVSRDGRLEVLLEDDSKAHYGIRDVKLLY